MGKLLPFLLVAPAMLMGAMAAAAAPDPGGDPAADLLVRKVWDATLRHCGDSAFDLIDGRVLIELDQPRFHLAPTRLIEAARVNGYQYQATAIASARRWRWAALGDGRRALEWSAWQETQTLDVRFDEFGVERGHALVEDAVLQFDLVRKDGVWTANHPLSPLNSDFRSFDLAGGAMAPAMPTCDRLTDGGERR